MIHESSDCSEVLVSQNPEVGSLSAECTAVCLACLCDWKNPTNHTRQVGGYSRVAAAFLHLQLIYFSAGSQFTGQTLFALKQTPVLANPDRRQLMPGTFHHPVHVCVCVSLCMYNGCVRSQYADRLSESSVNCEREDMQTSFSSNNTDHYHTMQTHTSVCL